jgi:hypothetical protein
MGDGPGAGGAGEIRGMRRRGERGGETTGVLKGEVELSGNVLKTRVFLVGDLLGAKNTGVTSRGQGEISKACWASYLYLCHTLSDISYVVNVVSRYMHDWACGWLL